jgi:DNA-binding NtrC family response regulator
MSTTGPRETTLILKTDALAPEVGAWLVVDLPGQPSRWIEIGDQPLVVGTGKECAVVLDDPHVSNRHAELVRNSAGIVLRDLGSSNGTRIANIAIKEAVLSSGTEITVGTTRLRFEMGGEAGKLARLAHEPVRDDELASVPPRIGGAVGSSLAMRRIFALLGRLAPTDLTITLVGETGTGKDVLARAIHQVSPRANAPFVVFDCAAAPHSLIESELFGHEKGAFTSAMNARVGVFERAHRGTLFIDEIGEMPLDLQPKLLRALEERQVQRLGAGGSRPFDVRIVAATNRNLDRLVEAGAFRRDLFFRLSTAILQVPLLRDHVDDIPDLIAYFLGQMGRPLTVTPAALALLRAHEWPGNVRELRNVINSAAALARDSRLDVKDLVFFQQRQPTGATPTSAPVTTPSAAIPTGRSLQAQEKAAIQQALQAHGGNRTHAARSLGIAISTLYTKIKKYCLNQDDDTD